MLVTNEHKMPHSLSYCIKEFTIQLLTLSDLIYIDKVLTEKIQ